MKYDKISTENSRSLVDLSVKYDNFFKKNLAIAHKIQGRRGSNNNNEMYFAQQLLFPKELL